MRVAIFFHLLAIILVIAAAALVAFIFMNPPGGYGWILYGVVGILGIGVILVWKQIHSFYLKNQEDSIAEELSVAQARFQAIFNDSAVGIGIVGLDRRALDANPELCRMFGMTREEIIGIDVSLPTFPEDDPRSIQLFNELASGRQGSYETDRRYIRKNGKIFWAHVTMSVVRGPDKKPRYLVGMLMDIDKQKRDALALEESEARFRAAFESSAIGMALTTPQGNFIETNAAIRKMSGYTEKELEGRNEVEVSFPQDLEIGREFANEIVAGKRDYFQVERRFVRKNGEVFWASLTLSAVRGAEGQLNYFVALIQDIDEQKRILAELKKSEARFQAVFQNVAVGIAILSLDGHILAINPATEQIVGYTQAELQQMDPLDLMHAEDRVADTAKYEELITGKRNSYVSEARYRRKNGALYWVRVNYSMVLDLDGQPDYLIALVENIDEEKRTAEKLAAQEAEYRRALEQRINERTEELNRANLLLQQKAAQDAINSERTRLARDLHDAVTQTLFSASLIAEVLPTIWEMNQAEGRRRLEELRQLTRGALAEMRMLLIELRPNALTEVPLPDLLRQLCESVIGRDRLPVQFNLEGNRKLPAAVQVGLYRIAQEALNNIVRHAKATQAIVTLRLGAQVCLVVEDNGYGFDMSAVPLDHFGLQIMRERADSIGANLSIYSEPNEGTRISISWQEGEQ